MSSDEEDFKVNKTSHKKLLSEINDIVKFQHIKKPKRTEPAIKNDEFHLIKTKSLGDEDDENSAQKSNKKSVAITALANLVRKNENQKKISNQFQDTFKKQKVLKKPLEKIHADRIQRTIAYDSTKNKLSKWDAIVTKNKNADQLKFPLNYDKTYMKDDNKEIGFSNLRYKTKMVQEMEAIHNECFPKGEEPELPKNDSELLTLEEMKERRKELARLKMRENYQITKKRLQGKIKSKKYHRLKKRDDIKQKLKEFEELKAVNPEAALKELEKIDKQRIQERVNLRHKNTGTWAKNMKIRAKYDTTAQQEIEAQLQIARELTQKQTKESSDSDSDEEMPSSSNKNADNPWLSGKNPEDDNDIFSGYRKFWEEKNANDKALKKLRKVNEKQEEKPEEPEVKEKEENGKIENEGSEESDEEQSASENDEESSENGSDEEAESQNNSKNGWIEEDVSSDNEDPSNFINDLFDKAEENINKKMESKLKELKPKLLASNKPEKKPKKKSKAKPDVNDPKYLEFEREARLGDIDEALNEGSDDENAAPTRLPPSKKLKNEIEELKEEKKAFMRGTKDEIDPSSFLNVKSKHLLTSIPKTQELDDVDEEEYETLAAANKMSLAEAFENDDIIHDFIEDVEEEAKKNQKTNSGTLMGWGSWAGEGIKEKKRRFIDRNPQIKRKDRVIVNTTPHESLKKHLISSVPFPFTTIKDFQASMRVPIGKDFIPSSAHSKLTMESVVTKAGTIIEPMSEEALVKTKDERKKRKFMKNKMKKPVAR
ncbi:U3 small nucleolar RNA-associated protein 14 homolog A-like [Chironomus tepperi]|uniref:U3 small nucleolar RNA-associated protein 14 homolog A-like n=1 Tax=Chironomus tepperi TaxID=113505 RepID=UPI00391F218B